MLCSLLRRAHIFGYMLRENILHESCARDCANVYSMFACSVTRRLCLLIFFRLLSNVLCLRMYVGGWGMCIIYYMRDCETRRDSRLRISESIINSISIETHSDMYIVLYCILYI